MDSEHLPRGTFKYGPTGAVLLNVKYVEIVRPRLVPVRDPFDWLMGMPDELLVSAPVVMEFARCTGVSPLVGAHFTIAYNAAKLAVGRAIPAYDAGLLDRPNMWEQAGGLYAPGDLQLHRAHRDLLATEMAGTLARMHPNPADPWGIECVRFRMLTVNGIALDRPLQRDFPANITGDFGVKVACQIRKFILPWFRKHLGTG